MRATSRRYSRNWMVHAIIVAIAVLIGIVVAFSARPTRGDQVIQQASLAAGAQPDRTLAKRDSNRSPQADASSFANDPLNSYPLLGRCK